MTISRREILQAFGLGLLAINLPVYAQKTMLTGIPLQSKFPLLEPDANGLRLPSGFTSRIVAESRMLVGGTEYRWHDAPDGGAVLATDDGGWVYVSNSESVFTFGNPKGGGAGAIRFNDKGDIVDAYRLLSGTFANCAGGMTPWGSWLSCEEFDLLGKNVFEFDFSPNRSLKAGLVWETFPLEPGKEAIAHPQMGAFQHEAATFDDDGIVYLTEDRPDGCFYRYLPKAVGDLSEGELQVAVFEGSGPRVRWETVPDPTTKSSKPTRKQVKGAAQFKGGEGAAYKDGIVFFSTKKDNRIWMYDTSSSDIEVLYDASESSHPILTGVDNLAISPSGQLVVAEDGGNMELVAVNIRGEAFAMLQVVGHGASEITGPAFSPDGQKLYFSSQRGSKGKSAAGVTFEVSGPFQDLLY